MALSSPCKLIHLFAHDREANAPLIKTLEEKGIPHSLASEGILKKISETSYLIPFVAIACYPNANLLGDSPVVILDGVKDFGNIGTIVRTAEAFGITQFASTDQHLDFFYKKTIDASRGKVFFSHLQTHASPQEALTALKKKGYQIAVATTRKSILQSFARIDSRPLAIAFGNETTGVSSVIEEGADLRIQIPMSGTVESLNVGVAAGICLYELKIKWTLAMLNPTHPTIDRKGSLLCVQINSLPF